MFVVRLLAGAPKEEAKALQNVNETGAVYSCPITTDPTDCSRMDLVSTSKHDAELSDVTAGFKLGFVLYWSR